MGNSTFNMASLASFSASVAHQTQDQIFANQTGTAPALDPAKFTLRESVDSPANPNSTPIIIAVDMTGSMGYLAENIIRKDLTTVVKGLYDNKPVSDPHIMLAVVGDSAPCGYSHGFTDTSPIQATQFEASIVLMDQAKEFYLEGNGGGNAAESYSMVWALAAHKVQADCISKRHRKGYIFTVGDERTHMTLTRAELKQFLGVKTETDIATADLLEHVKQNWNVFHLIVRTPATQAQGAIQAWKDLLGENAVVLEDASNVGEMVTALIQLNEGNAVDDVATDWDPIVKARVAKSLAASGRKIEL